MVAGWSDDLGRKVASGAFLEGFLPLLAICCRTEVEGVGAREWARGRLVFFAGALGLLETWTCQPMPNYMARLEMVDGTYLAPAAAELGPARSRYTFDGRRAARSARRELE